MPNPSGQRQAHFLRDFREVSRPIVVIYQWRDRRGKLRMAVRSVAFSVLATPDIVKVPLKVTEHDYIKQSVSIQIGPRRGGGSLAATDAGPFRHIGKSSVSIVVSTFGAIASRSMFGHKGTFERPLRGKFS